MLLSPIETGIIHFVGICGIGMSAIADVLNRMGYNVQGSDHDSANSSIANRLQKSGIYVYGSHESQNISKARLIVYSSAININENPEILEAKKHKIKTISKAEMLNEIMRSKISIAISGTHGKTTMTTLVGYLLDGLELNPGILAGGIMNNYGSNSKIGKSDYLVIEADESDGSMIKLTSYISVITNIELEHVNYYKDENQLMELFKIFASNVLLHGSLVICYDQYNSRMLSRELSGNDSQITYGLAEEYLDKQNKLSMKEKMFYKYEPMVKACNIRLNNQGMVFDIMLSPSMIENMNNDSFNKLHQRKAEIVPPDLFNNQELSKVNINADSTNKNNLVENDDGGNDKNKLSKQTTTPEIIKNIQLPMYGMQNISNALGAISTIFAMNFKSLQRQDPFQGFKGIHKRFNVLYDEEFTLISDYAHHPTEIDYLIKQTIIYNISKSLKPKEELNWQDIDRYIQETEHDIVLVFEPHRYSRLKYFLRDFVQVLLKLKKIIILPVYDKDPFVSKRVEAQDLSNFLNDKQAEKSVCVEKFGELFDQINNNINKNTLVVFAGAGDSDFWAKNFLNDWKETNNKSEKK